MGEVEYVEDTEDEGEAHREDAVEGAPRQAVDEVLGEEDRVGEKAQVHVL